MKIPLLVIFSSHEHTVAEYSYGMDYNLKGKASWCEHCARLSSLPQHQLISDIIEDVGQLAIG